MTDNTNSSNNDDAEKMRLAFEQFMLSGGKNNKNSSSNNSQANRTNDEASTPQSTSNKSKKKKKKKRQSTSSSSSGATPTKVAPTPTSKQALQSPQSTTATTTANPKIKKRYYQLLRSYTDKIKHTWMDIDEQLLSVLQNVGSIRGRLPYEWKVFSQVSESRLYHQEDEEEQVEDWFESPEQEEEFDDGNDEDDWKSHGYQQHSKKSSSQYLQINDLQLALSHDLEQHEKMLVGLRSLMSNLAECHDALGRIVDSLWQYHFEVEEVDEYDAEKNEGMMMKKDNDILEYIVSCVNESYQMLSMELYRKQNLIALVIESTKDEIFGMNDELLGKGPIHGGTKSQKLVRECCSSWKRSSSDEELLSNVLKLGES